MIFATCTTVLYEKTSKDFNRYNEEIAEYNKTAVEVVKKYGFEINDLFTLSESLGDDAHSDPVHYHTSVGTEAFTKQVLSFVVPALGIEDEIEYLYVKEPVGI